MAELLAAARSQGAAILWLGVWERNARALEFYRRIGFRAVGDQPFLLGDDLQRDLVLRLELEATGDRRG